MVVAARVVWRRLNKQKSGPYGPLFCLFLLLCNYWRTSIFSRFFRFNNWFSSSGFICSLFSSGGTFFNRRWNWVWLSTTISTWANTRNSSWWSILNRFKILHQLLFLVFAHVLMVVDNQTQFHLRLKKVPPLLKREQMKPLLLNQLLNLKKRLKILVRQ